MWMGECGSFPGRSTQHQTPSKNEPNARINERRTSPVSAWPLRLRFSHKLAISVPDAPRTPRSSSISEQQHQNKQKIGPVRFARNASSTSSSSAAAARLRAHGMSERHRRRTQARLITQNVHAAPAPTHKTHKQRQASVPLRPPPSPPPSSSSPRWRRKPRSHHECDSRGC